MLVYWPYARKQHIFSLIKIFFWKICILYICIYYFLFFFYFFYLWVGWLSAHPLRSLGCQPSLSRAGLSAQRKMSLGWQTGCQPRWTWAVGPKIHGSSAQQGFDGLGLVKRADKPNFSRAGLPAKTGWKPSPFSGRAGCQTRPNLTRPGEWTKSLPPACKTKKMNSNNVIFRVCLKEKWLIPLCRGLQGGSYGRCIVGNSGMWWPELSSEGNGYVAKADAVSSIDAGDRVWIAGEVEGSLSSTAWWVVVGVDGQSATLRRRDAVGLQLLEREYEGPAKMREREGKTERQNAKEIEKEPRNKTFGRFKICT